MDISIKKYIADGVVPEYAINALEQRLIQFRASGAQNPPNSSTVNGFCTDNVVSDEVVSELIPVILSAFTDGNKLFTCHWVHMIEYDDGGWAHEHDHGRTEQYSFIVYLNTPQSNGKTCLFLDNGDVVAVAPMRGKVLFFPAHLRHLGEPTVGTKRVVVGALNLK